MPDPSMTVCDRFHADGAACTHLTDHADGWCRQPDCGGFRRANPGIAPEGKGGLWVAKKHLAAGGSAGVPSLELDEIPGVRITLRAVESFRFHHGGSAEDAEVELRLMLEDFLVRSVRHTSDQGYLTLSREGYTLVLSPDRDSLVGYHTGHRERTWSQVKAGVPTRFGKRKRVRQPSAEGRPEPGQPVPWETDADFRSLVDADTIFLTSRVRTSFDRLTKARELTEEELDRNLRAAFGLDLATGVVTRDPETGCARVQGQAYEWMVSPELTSLISVRNC